jgi:hypothetical protein
MRRMLKLSAAAFACAALLVAGPALADTTLAPSQVAAVTANQPNQTSPNGETVGGFVTVNYNDGAFNYGLVQFDLTGQDPVSAAVLSLSHVFNAADATFGLFEVVSAWDPATVTFNTRPSNAPNPFATFQTFGADNGGTDYLVEVTGMVNDWISGAHANHGLALIRTDNLNPFLYFQGSETPCCGGHGPRLLLTSASSGAPEPATWALMIGGLALAGAALRRARETARA